MTRENQYAHSELETIKVLLNRGEISYDEAKAQAQPHIETLNKTVKEISREYGVTFKPLTFISVMR
jgi:cupin superfamily acireductone dioxygenase involved in methionine salvage